MNFKPNDKVVCIGLGSPSQRTAILAAYTFTGAMPVKDSVYVVESVRPHTGGVGLNLVGSCVIHNATGIVAGFDASYFRKLEEVQAENREKADVEALIKEARELINLY